MATSISSPLQSGQSGVFKAPRALPALREAARRAHCVWLEVNLQTARDKAGFLAACARDLKFPPHFGANWDAFSDCINDLAWEPADGYVIVFENLALFARHAPDEAATMLEILRAAADAWRIREKIFIVLIDYAPPASDVNGFPEPPPA